MYDRTPIAPPTILIVEDSPDDAMIVGLTFQEAGINNPMEFVEDGEQAIDYLLGQGRYTDRHRWPLPLLVILDLNLPRFDGIEVLASSERILTEHEIPVVVLSVSDHAVDRDRAVELGASHVIRKPIDPATLLATVADIRAFGLLMVRAPESD